MGADPWPSLHGLTLSPQKTNKLISDTLFPKSWELTPVIETNSITNIFFCTYYNIETKMKIVANAGQYLPIDPLGPTAFAIPKVLGISSIVL